eukprot:TRINITY_DN233_c0_g2_i1.p1 TRINITY_DN233_c0_g2~~TRINITY_DN233_c0_g2_i1.p1  ORF type:complete len:226 (+),score=111.62 TRINITY_DN233_c0_g2_i1:164-841(+)
MSDSDIDFDDNASECDFDDWEDAEEEKEMQKEKDAKAKEDEQARKDEILRKKQERRDRIEAAKGNVDDDAIEEIDMIGEKEYKDRLAQHEVEVTYGDMSNKFESKPIATMNPETKEEFTIMGEKLGNCMKTFRSSKFFFYALNLLVNRTSDKIGLEDCQELSKKLNVILAERQKATKEGSKPDKKKDKAAEDGEAEPLRGEAAVNATNEGRNDLKGDGRDLGDFM